MWNPWNNPDDPRDDEPDDYGEDEEDRTRCQRCGNAIYWDDSIDDSTPMLCDTCWTAAQRRT